MEQWTDGQTDESMDGSNDDSMGQWIDRWIDEGINRSIDRWQAGAQVSKRVIFWTEVKNKEDMPCHAVLAASNMTSHAESGVGTTYAPTTHPSARTRALCLPSPDLCEHICTNIHI